MTPREEKFLHDISSPLGGIEILLETLLDDVPDKDTTGMRERVLEALRGLRKIRDLLETRRDEVDSE